MKPRIGITLGDPAGIGPEIVVKALCEQEVQACCHPVVFGDRWVFERTAAELGLAAELEASGVFEFVDSGVVQGNFSLGQVSAIGGQAAFTAIRNAIQAAQDGAIAALATAPINKESLKAAGVEYIGHTEILAGLTGSPDPLTLFVVRDLRVFFVSRHVSLRKACDLVTRENLVRFTLRAYRELQRLLGLEKPKLAIAGLNPHNGEHGLFGDEEVREIEPAVAELQERGLDVVGPYPADSVFYRALQGEFAAVVSLYHDQGHIATKMVDFECTISMTLGLPFLRTSVDHGTAFDIAGKGVASPVSMVEAIKMAARYTHI
ncbi:MAG: 4-hydroxythreonine-4-phosphate dehydrogenase PdxA [Firmicutes bacterium]|nr:4-hydroxythreonine-4-phosphate dehydrogenase PdxA [Bacillota bacterium]